MRVRETSAYVNIRTVDLADRRNPDKSGRYVNLADLLTALSEVRKADNRFAAIEDLILQVAKQR